MKYLLGLAMLFINSSSFALSSFIDSWESVYPNSSSAAELRCQLCHLQRDGGSPWNAYGNDIRRIFRQDLDINTRSIEQAIRMAELLNSDQDSPPLNNIDEINANQQPAWRPGSDNQAFDRNFNLIGSFNQPVTLNPITQEIQTSDSPPLALEELVDGLVAPIAANAAPITALNQQLFVADQVGIIWRVDLVEKTKSVYLDFQSDLVQLGAFTSCGYDERGLLGFAFHPLFESNGLIYVYLSQEDTASPDFTTLNDNETPDHQSVVVEVSIANPSSSSGMANILSRRDILRIDQPQFNHNGGALIFDSLNYLYIGLGDGGSADDQGVGHGDAGNGNDSSTILGSILRIDPLGSNSSNRQYGIPSSNPFINDPDQLDEIYAYGLRNPWKLYFDGQQQLFAADVGQNDIEEINLIESGAHYGWSVREGSFFFYNNDDDAGTIGTVIISSLPTVSLVDPIFEYDHDEGIAVTGGQAYQGRASRFLRNKHVFSDFNRRIFVGTPSTGDIQELGLSADIFINSISQDANGELYVLGNQQISTCDTLSTGKVIAIKSTEEIINEPMCFPIKTNSGSVATICL